jgi:hypothetical protein
MPDDHAATSMFATTTFASETIESLSIAYIESVEIGTLLALD